MQTRRPNNVSLLLDTTPGFTHSCGDGNILRKDNTLALNDEEVDEVFEVIERGFESFLGELVVSPRSNSACDTGAHESFARSLGKRDNCCPCQFISFPPAIGVQHTTKSHPSDLQHIAEDGEVAASEDKGNGSDKGDTGGSLVLPLRIVSHAQNWGPLILTLNKV